MLKEFFERRDRELQLQARHQGESQMLSRLLSKRFGRLPDPIHFQLRIADLDQLELWGEQLLDATSLTDLFPEPHNPTPRP